jgi:uncharacterized membrane protein
MRRHGNWRKNKPDFMSNFEARLRVETVEWVNAGLVSEGQRAALLERHPVAAQSGRFVAILSIIGGSLLLAGVALLISANWEGLSDGLKIGGLLLLLIAAYVGGYWAKVKPGRYAKTGDALFMVGAGLFMGGIALVSQIYHLNSRPPTGVLVWWLGIVAVPWLVESKGAQAVSLLAWLTWLGMEFVQLESWLRLVESARAADNGITLTAMMTVIGLGVWLGGLALAGRRYAGFAGLHEKWGALIVCAGLYALP